MKVIIEFDLDNSEEKKKYRIINKMEDIFDVIHSINMGFFSDKIDVVEKNEVKQKLYKELFELFEDQIIGKDSPTRTENC